ncbi:acetylornithine deacetylase [Candidatus Poribacteria bacterium]|nr:acetylornithine deacetylase [Candidatus Poribacteria bacterium]
MASDLAAWSPLWRQWTWSSDITQRSVPVAEWSLSDNPILADLQRAVAIESINPALPGGDRGEAAMVEFTRAFFAECGVACETEEVLPDRCNVVATLPGRDPDRVLLFESHIDTASTQGMTIDPFAPHIRDGMLYGRGSCDTKAGGIAMMHAMRRIAESGEPPPSTIQFAGAMDEEHTFKGALALAQSTRASAVVVSEPTDLAVIRAHNGLARFLIHVTGVAAHSSKPELGVNAISKMARIVTAIEDEIETSYAALRHPLTGHPRLNVGVIQGGVQINFVPDHCVIEVDRRVIPGEDPLETVRPFRELLARLASEDPELDAQLEAPFLLDNSMETPEDAEIVQVAAAACEATLGASTIDGVPYGTDASKFTAIGIPSIVLGPGCIDQAHAAVEWVECQQVLDATDIYYEIMRRF